MKDVNQDVNQCQPINGLLDRLKQGMNPTTISKQLGITRQAVHKRLSTLKKDGRIKKIGYGVWEVMPQKDVNPSTKDGQIKSGGRPKNVRGHAFIWKLKLEGKYSWEDIFNRKGIPFRYIGALRTPQKIVGGKSVWFGKTFVTVFEPKGMSYWGSNPVEARSAALSSLMDTIEELRRIIGEFRYSFSCSRQHYGFINNPEAKHFIHKGQRVYIKNEKGYWFSIDNSQNIWMEAETLHEVDAVKDGSGYQELMNSHERTRFKVTPEWTLEAFAGVHAAVDGVLQNQVRFDANMMSHLAVLNKLGDAVDELRKEIKKFGGKL